MDGVNSMSLVSLHGEKGLVSRQMTCGPQEGNKCRQSCFKSEVLGMRKVGARKMELVTDKFGPYLERGCWRMDMGHKILR